MRWTAVLAFVSVLCLASPALTQTDDAAASAPSASVAELAAQYVNAGGAADNFIEGAAYGFRRSARSRGIEFTPTQWQRVHAAVREAFAPAAALFVHDMTAYYAANNSREDLAAAIAFYDTPEGARYLAAIQSYAFPLGAYLTSQGSTPLDAGPDAASIDPARLVRGRALAALLMSKMHPAERAQVELTSVGVDGVTDFIARSLASSMELHDLEAAIAWCNSPASMRLEGPSADRSLTAQAAIARAARVVDFPALQHAVQEAMRETPT